MSLRSNRKGKNMDQQFIDKLFIEKDILERKQIIQEYNTTGFLDRNNAISKIIDLRERDGQVALIYCVSLPREPVLLEQLTNKGLIDELEKQITVLEAELLNINNHPFRR